MKASQGREGRSPVQEDPCLTWDESLYPSDSQVREKIFGFQGWKSTVRLLSTWRHHQKFEKEQEWRAGVSKTESDRAIGHLETGRTGGRQIISVA